MMFAAQLDPLPPAVLEAELRAVTTLFPGPRGWIDLDTLKSLKQLHFPQELCDIQSAAIAAKARVATFENLKHGGLRVEARANHLRAVMAHPDNISRFWRVRG